KLFSFKHFDFLTRTKMSDRLFCNVLRHVLLLKRSRDRRLSHFCCLEQQVEKIQQAIECLKGFFPAIGLNRTLKPDRMLQRFAMHSAQSSHSHQKPDQRNLLE